MDEETLLIFTARQARRKAMPCALAEAVSLLRDLQARALAGGPLSEQGGRFWLDIPSENLASAQARLPRLGYTCAVETLEPLPGRSASDRRAVGQTVVWRGVTYRRVELYTEDAALLRDRAPDRRLFALETEDGQSRLIRGYRGDGGPLSRRALAVCDARLLVNLAECAAGAALLDPFAGAGGVALEAMESGYRVISADIDPILRPGLERLGATHYVADARHLPLPPDSLDAIATEPPYEDSATPAVVASLVEMRRVLKTGGRLAMLCAAPQTQSLQAQAGALGLAERFAAPLDRKGMACSVLVWEK